jgi:hypothetical protein
MINNAELNNNLQLNNKIGAEEIPYYQQMQEQRNIQSERSIPNEKIPTFINENNPNNPPNNMNQNPNNQNANINNNRANDDDDDDGENNNNNLSDFEKKKHELFLEMDEYQYKHIERYGESRKETECAICLESFKGIDMIKSFYKCNHIFHKKCLKDWLKRSNTCPLCNHDLTEDINNQAH